MYRITNMHNTIIFEDKAHSFYDAWQKMFTKCCYPDNEKIISKQIDLGLWIEKIGD